MKPKNLIKKMCFSSIMCALAYVTCAFLAIPYFNGAGYLNFSDVFTLVTSILVGPFYGALVGAISGALADLTVGMIQFVPFTLLAKSLLAILAGFLYPVFLKRLKIFSLFIAGLVMAAIYFASYVLFYGLGSYFSSIFDLIQISICSVLSYVFIQAIEQTYLKHVDQSIFKH